MMKQSLWIGLAGMAGALLRVGIGAFISVGNVFPTATFTVNIIATFLLCFLSAGILERILAQEDVRNAVTIGFLGAFSTFSALSVETVSLIEKGQVMIAMSYVVSSTIGGIFTAQLGFYIGRRLVGR